MTEEVLLDGHTGKINGIGEPQFSLFPIYARFILDNYLIPYIREQLKISRDIDLPMLRFFASMSEEDLITMSIPSHTQTLTAIAENRIKEQIETGLKSWLENRLPVIDRSQILAEDITLASYVRKQALLKFIPSYTSDIAEILQLVKEIDIYSKDTDTAATNVYIELLKGRLHEQDQQLIKSETLLLQAQAMSHTGNWTWDMDTKKLSWSDEIYRIYGLDPQSLETSETIALYNHPDDVGMLNEAIRQAIKTGQPFDLHYRIVFEDGVMKTLHARGEVMRDRGHEPLRIFGTLQDVTSQKEAEKQLKEYQEFIQKIADTAPSVIASYNIKTGEYNFISQGLEKILGYNPKEVIDNGVAFFMSIIHPDDIGPLMEKNAQILEKANLQKDVKEEEIVAEFKYRMLHKNGAYRWFHTFGTIFNRDSNNEVEQVLNISIDITEQETAEQALFQKNIELQQSNLSLEEYAYVASHDLKEPLRKIATYSDRLNAQESALNVEGKTYLGKIITSTKRMQTMINDLLSISMLSGQKKPELTDLNTIYEEALQTLEHQIEEQGAKIEANALPAVNVIPSQFRQLFQNLIGNSLKFTSVAPLITITHSFLKPQEVSTHKVAKAKKYLQLTFSDNGIGFDNQYAAKIFTIFQRLHGKAEYEGNGIGLSICRKIAENHGGTIYASGIPNKGANFTIIIPV